MFFKHSKNFCRGSWDDFGVQDVIISNGGALTFLLIYFSLNSNPLPWYAISYKR